MYGGTTPPEYPGILSIPDTVSVRLYVWTTREDPGILSILDTVCTLLNKDCYSNTFRGARLHVPV